MAKDYMNCNENIYYHCRKEAAKYNDKLNSREGASELLGVSVSSLADYELGMTKVVPVDKVVLMADLYNSPELINHYCNIECPIRRDFPTCIEPIEKIALTLIDALQQDKVNEMLRKLTKIALDGKVEESEKEDMQKIVKYFSDVCNIAEKLQLYEEKRKLSINDNS